jgi:LAO/AO transport system kinase
MPKLPDLNQLIDGVRKGDRAFLGRAISVVESTHPAYRELAEVLLDEIQVSQNTFRLGITGVPGAGKSTFIEQLGLFLAEDLGKKVAVLAIDPSSPLSGGSILGDKTRMNDLARHPNAFIRPSPSGGNLGGVARRTLESIRLCEAAGYEFIFIETVGVGQSEAVVKDLSDMLLLLLITGAGDQLQGIKRGIMELADVILINKADGDNQAAANRAVAENKQAVRLLNDAPSGWDIRVDRCSSLSKKDMEKVWDYIRSYFNYIQATGWLEENRSRQSQKWMRQNLEDRVVSDLMAWIQSNEEAQRILATVDENPFRTSRLLYELFARGS